MAHNVARIDDYRERRAPATTPDAQERRIIAGAYDLAERQIADGTASSQVISHFLKMGSSREHLEQERLEMEVSLMGAKKEAMDAAVRVESLYEEAITAMRAYAGQDDPEDFYEG